jgi:lysophospholipase L1-like esterase
VLLGVPAAILVGILAWLRSGSAVWGLVLGVLVFAIAMYSAFAATRSPSILIALLMLALVVGSLYYGVSHALEIYRAISTTEGPVDEADPNSVASAEAAIAVANAQNGFRIVLTEEEIGAYLQKGLGEIANNPIRRIEVDIEDAAAHAESGTLSIVGFFKSSGVEFSGTVGFHLDTGAIRVDVTHLEVGDLDLPGIGRDAIEDILAEVADLNEVLVGLNADVQSVTLGGDQIVVTGSHGGGATITSAALLTALADQAAGLGSAVEPPDQRLGPGEVNGTLFPGVPVLVALGDSLAANVGVDEPRRGYVSRVHAELQRRDARTLGLRNFGVSGETTGTMIRGGQLDAAIAYIQSVDVAYVTIDIGANDLLGHLGSDDCSDDIDSPDCSKRLDAAFTTYEANLSVILERLAAAAADAPVVYLTAYNPFSLGLAGGVGFEGRSDEILAAFNALATEVAEGLGVIVADGFTPMRGTTAATTHMLDAEPDIHPRAIGYGILAWAIIEALTAA